MINAEPGGISWQKGEPMKDPIERQEAIDEIEERKNANGYGNVAVISELNRLEGYIMRLPSAQPEIIHCKDCIWYELPNHRITENCVRWMKSNGILLPIKHDDFCSRAERKIE